MRLAQYLFIIPNVPPSTGVVVVIVAPAPVVVLGGGFCDDLIHQTDELGEDIVV